MRLPAIGSLMAMVVMTALGAEQQSPAPSRPAGVRLDDVSWRVAEERLNAESIVVLPLAPGAIEHGPHLPLGTERRLTDYLTRRLADELDVVIAPPLSYHHYPAFSEYAGSTSLSLNTARDFTADVARSLGRHGPRRFYVLDTSLTPSRALPEAAKLLASEGLLLRFTDARGRLDATIRSLQRQPFGAHADEIETSMMLFVDPSAVDMPRAVRELGAESIPFMLSRRDSGRATYSPGGVWGDPTLATREKGAVLVEALLRAVRGDIDDLRRTPPPIAAAEIGTAAETGPRSGRAGTGRAPGECLPGDDRSIRGIGPAFSLAWINQDAVRISQFWAPEGDMVHPDGFIEGSQLRILENRTALFMRPEYKNSRHSLMVGAIRCIASDIAIADAKWELRNVTDAKGQIIPPSEGLCTLVLRRRPAAGWSIEAWRYSNKPEAAMPAPALLKRPGYPGIGK